MHVGEHCITNRYVCGLLKADAQCVIFSHKTNISNQQSRETVAGTTSASITISLVATLKRTF